MTRTLEQPTYAGDELCVYIPGAAALLRARGVPLSWHSVGSLARLALPCAGRHGAVRSSHLGRCAHGAAPLEETLRAVRPLAPAAPRKFRGRIPGVQARGRACQRRRCSLSLHATKNTVRPRVLGAHAATRSGATIGAAMPRSTAPTVPEYRSYFTPILKALKALGGSASIDELNSRVASDMTLLDAVLAIPHNPEHGGRSEVAYRMAWARTYLKASGLLTNSERGVWSLTPAGAKTERVDEKQLAKEVQTKRRGMRPRTPRHEHGDETEDDDDDATEGAPTDWKHELLETLQSMPPDAFERLAQRILRESGFVEVTVTGRSGDRGIDGIGLLKLQEVLTFHVIFQCKRWREPVGASTVRDFRGAMVGRTDKGLIITTTYFTPEAIREATRDGAPAIDLLDGETLVMLLKKLKLGVKTELVERVTVEREWFEAI